MNRVPVLVRLTAAFVVTTTAMLVAAALFVGVRLRADLDDRVDETLEARSRAAVSAYRRQVDLSDVPLEDREEGFVQVLDRAGTLLEQSGTIQGPALSPAEVAKAERGRVVRERRLPGVDGQVRVLATPVEGDGTRAVVVVGQSLLDRDEALTSLVQSFTWGGLVTVALAAVCGYVWARAGLAPVERMRAKAALISVSGSPDLLPLPAAHDEISRLGETLNAMLVRLRAGVARERRFVADASHEIRTPLATMRLELEATLTDTSLPPEVRESLTAAHTECLRLARLAEDLLVLARLDDGRLPLRPGVVDVRAEVLAVTGAVTGDLDLAGRRLEVDVPPGVVVAADPDRFRQVVTNLVDNASRHGAGTVTVSAAPEGSGVLLVVSDEGAGFPAGFEEQAFDRFSRADEARPRAGAGLGLSLVAAIAQAHGGRAWVRAGRPAAVCVWLPRSHPSLI